jgi:hypothetical protein
LSEIRIYPVKSGAGLSVPEWVLDERGLAHDREFMVVDADGRFLTQRQYPQLALVRPSLGPPPGITTPDGTAVTRRGARMRVRVWEHAGPAVDCGDDAADLLGTLLHRPVRLAQLVGDHGRRTSRGDAPVGFADGYPLLITTTASLAELNRRLADPLPMDRFRPNLVIDGCAPFDEDGWGVITAGPVGIDVVKPCTRCAITRVDQDTGRRSGREPLAVLATFRRIDAGLAFGQNAIHRSQGVLRVGDPVSVREPRR